jgi:hypothetical protein
MQIYGDTTCEMRIATFAGELVSRIDSRQDLATWRAILIACGELEQLVSDAAEVSESVCARARRATEHAAAAFYAIWSRDNPIAASPSWSVESEARALRSQLGRLTLADTVGTLKLPEGFAFYALYPEQYCAAAVAYLARRRSGQGTAHVIGLRSIGTTLSAAVAVVLRAARVPHRRYTVRPHGHPFDRRVELPEPFAAHDVALVVDEGPGLSGSSFFSVARALNARDVSASRQAYFCAHPQPPGKMASAEIQRFWRHAERYVASSQDSSISPAGSLSATLRAELSRQCRAEVGVLEDLSNGRWREPAFGASSSWPACYSAFERPKLLAHLADGRRVLLKYYGQVLCPPPLARHAEWSDAAAARHVARSGSRVWRSHGYVARYWLEGELLTVRDKSPAVLDRLARFLAYRPWRRVREGGSSAQAYQGAPGPLGPREWLKQTSGRVVKLPETLAGYDHTAVGVEPLAWDLAAAVVEWQLSHVEAEALLALFQLHSGLSVQLPELKLTIREYAEFHLEKARFCAALTDASEALRLEGDVARYGLYEKLNQY